MKRLIVRVGALGTVVVLGLIAIAQAQRGCDAPNPPRQLAAADASPLRHGATASDEANPLRLSGERSVEPDSGPAIKLTGLEEEGVSVASDPPDSSAMGAPPDPFRGAILREPATAEAAPPTDRYEPLPSADPPAMRMAADADVGLDDPREAEPPGGPTVPAEPRNQPRLLVSAEDSAVRPADDDRYSPLRPNRLPGDEPDRFDAGSLEPPARLTPPESFDDDTFGGQDSFPTADRSTTDTPSPSLGEGTARPGSKQLEGPQSPQVTVEKTAPAEIQVGKPATFTIRVRNSGSVPAADVEVHDRVPRGTRLLGTTPRASRGAEGDLVWSLGTMEPGQETTCEVQLMPTDEGEVGSVATVHFRAEASVRTRVTRPQLVLKTAAPRQVLIGEKLTLEIEISNPGSGAATGVVLAEQVPPGLSHAAGGDLEYEVGDLPPGASRRLELTMTAEKAGPITNVLVAQGDGSLKAEDRLDLQVVAPELEIALEGPKKRYLEREATYQLLVHNPGTAPARGVELVAYLPEGMQFVRANNAGQYEASDRAIRWRLEELPINETGAVELTAVPIEAGQQNIRLRGTADRGLRDEKEHPVLVEGIAAIMFTAADLNDPLEIGGQTNYEIRVVNQGTKASTNVQLVVDFPPELQPVAAEGPTRNSLQGNRVVFDTLARLAPKADTTYRVRAKGVRPGDLRVRFQLLTDEMQSPVVKEESTRVYSDE